MVVKKVIVHRTLDRGPLSLSGPATQIRLLYVTRS